MNRVFSLDYINENTEELMEQIIEEFRVKKATITWIVCPSTQPEDMGKSLAGRGFNHVNSWVGMATDLKNFKNIDIEEGDLEITEINDKEGLEIWADTVSKGFGVPEEILEEYKKTFINLEVNRNKPYTLYLATKDGVPVGTTVLYIDNGEAGLYWISTIPEARKQGIANTLINYVLKKAALEECHMAILQATPIGKPVYEKLGFREHCYFNIYVYRFK